MDYSANALNVWFKLIIKKIKLDINTILPVIELGYTRLICILNSINALMVFNSSFYIRTW